MERAITTLRKAGLNDIPVLLDFGKKLLEDSTYSQAGFDEDVSRYNLERFILDDGKQAMVLLSMDGDKPVGTIVAYNFQTLFSKQKVAVECVWYLEPEYRTIPRATDMMEAFEYWAKQTNCFVAQYGLLQSADPRLAKLYQRRGCTKVEEVYYKEV